MTKESEEEITPISEENKEWLVENEVKEEEKEKPAIPVKQHLKFNHPANNNTKFWPWNKFGWATGKRMGRAAQRGR